MVFEGIRLPVIDLNLATILCRPPYQVPSVQRGRICSRSCEVVTCGVQQKNTTAQPDIRQGPIASTDRGCSIIKLLFIEVFTSPWHNRLLLNQIRAIHFFWTPCIFFLWTLLLNVVYSLYFFLSNKGFIPQYFVI